MFIQDELVRDEQQPNPKLVVPENWRRKWGWIKHILGKPRGTDDNVIGEALD